MVLKRTKNEVRAALATNIMETCRQVLPDIDEIYVEGLLGVTLNKREIFLVNLSDIYSKEDQPHTPKRKRGRRSVASSEFRKDYHLDESLDDEESASKRPSGIFSYVAGATSDVGEDQNTPQGCQDMNTYYIKEEEMTAPDDFSIPKVGRPPKQTFPELEDVPPIKLTTLASSVQPEQPLKLSLSRFEVPTTRLPMVTPCVRLPNLDTLGNVDPPKQQDSEKNQDSPKLEKTQSLQKGQEEPVLDLSVDRKEPADDHQNDSHIDQNVSIVSNASNMVGLPTMSCPNNYENVFDGSNNPNKSRRKRGRPRKISDDSIKSAEYLVANAFSRQLPISQAAYQPKNQFAVMNSQIPASSAKSHSDQPQDFSKNLHSSESTLSRTILDVNMNSSFNLGTQSSLYEDPLNADTPVSLVANAQNIENTPILKLEPIDQLDSNSNSQPETFSQVQLETNQSEGSSRSPDQSENSFQSGPVFPHLEEYDGVPFNSSMDDSFNDSNLDGASANESQDDDKIELTSTGRPKRKTAMSPWVRQFFNITTGGGESKTVQIKATQTCPICQKVFSAGSHLKRHYLVTHTNSSKFQCQICTKRFGSADHLKRHMGTHAPEKKFKCHLCNRRFNVKYRLTEHITEKHSINDLTSEQRAALDNQDDIAMVTNQDDVSMDADDSMHFGNVYSNESAIPT